MAGMLLGRAPAWSKYSKTSSRRSLLNQTLGQKLVCIATVESFFMLRYLAEKVATAQETEEGVTEDGIDDFFEVLCEIQEVVKTGLWVGDCFIYTSSVNKLNYYVGGAIVTIAHLDRTMYLLRLVLYPCLRVTVTVSGDFGMADRVQPTIPKEMRTRVADFLEKQGFRRQALTVSTDSEHRFELALHLGELKIAYQLAVEAESEQKWKQLAELATTKCQFVLAQECLHHAQDYGGLLLLATASGNTTMVGKLTEGGERWLSSPISSRRSCIIAGRDGESHRAVLNWPTGGLPGRRLPQVEARRRVPSSHS
ncbi:coatomer subunit beta'-like [Oncorhynchus masou masou]|uniref:coatomer subunit beta'-like n=1 Tax=Oncorhynchus masou masou TaxID=90313 RepID=UPI003182EF13